MSTPRFAFLIVGIFAGACSRDSHSLRQALEAPPVRATGTITPVATATPTPTNPPITGNPSPRPGPRRSDEGTEIADCQSPARTEIDACLFYKNPVVAHGEPILGGLKFTTDTTPFQIYGVKLATPIGSALSSADYRIIPGGSAASSTPGGPQPVTKNPAGNWKYAYADCAGGACSADPDHRTGQLMAYYWLTSQARFMKERTGAFYATGKSILVDTALNGIANAYFDSSTNQLILGLFGNTEFALSADVYLHEAGHANLHFAAGGTMDAGGFTRQCPSAGGCLGAIHEGQADFHAALVFSDRTALGEGITNTMEGLDTCGSRDVNRNRDLTAAAAYTDTAPCGAGVGEIHSVGRVYASIWWELRRGAGDDAGAREIERLFTQHLPTIAADDDFVSARAKILAVDQALFAGRHQAAITAEFARRGL